MKFLVSVIFLSFSNYVFAWTCSDYGSEEKNSIDYHYSVASDILFGRIVAGSFDPKREHTTEFELKIHKSFKGEKSGSIVLKTHNGSYFEDIVLGENYIFTLYGDNTVSFCGYNHRLGTDVRNIERLRNIATHENAVLHKTIKSFFEFVDYTI